MSHPLLYMYARISSAGQDLLGQEKQLKDWASSQRAKYEYLEDIGTGKNMKRPSMQKMIADVEAGRVAKIVVCSINRLGRNAGEVWRFMESCRAKGVTLVSLREGLDSSTPMGKAMAQIIAVLGELENEIRSEATKAGIRAKKEEAEKHGREWKFGGSRKGWSHKVTEEIAIAIRALHSSGKSYRSIAKVVHLDSKTVRDVVLNPRQLYVTRKELASLQRKLDAFAGKSE